MKQVIAMHGWSGDSNSWRGWSYFFKRNGWIWQSGERGYGELPMIKPQWQKQAKQSLKTTRAVIVHSLGLHLLDREVLTKATHIVLLCSFSRFLPEGNNSRVLFTALKRMQSLIGTSQEGQMLESFLEKACYPDPTTTIPPGPITKGISSQGRVRLKDDLELLVKSKGIPAGFPRNAKVLAVDSEEDSIVVPEAKAILMKDLLNHLQTLPTHWSLPRAGHSLLSLGLGKRVQNWLESCP